jgi:hypothetical protein
MTPGDQPNTPAISTYQCDVNRVVWNQIWCCFEPTRDGLFTCAKQLQLNSYQFCLFILQFKDPTSQTTKRTLLKRWVSLPNKDSSNIPAPAPSSIVHLSSLYSVSHALPPLDTHNLLWILSSIWQSTSLHWLPLHVRRVGCVLLNNSIQFNHGQIRWISAKTTALTSFDGETRCNQHPKAHLTSLQSQLAQGMPFKQ